MAQLPSFIKFNLDGGEELVDVTARFEPDVGPDLTRRKASGIPRIWNYNETLIDAHVNELLDFYEDPNKGDAGNKEVDVAHPRRNGVTVKAKFLGPPRIDPVNSNSSRVRFSILVKPDSQGL